MSERLGRRGLARLHEHLSARDLAVIDSVSKHRFLTGKQLERLHFHEHSTKATGARVCRDVLARLTRQRLLTRLRRRVGGVRAGSVSYVYALGPVGRRLVDAEAPRHVSEPSSTFLAHTLAVADAHLALVEGARGGGFELIEVEIEPAAWRRYPNAAGAHQTLRPDLYAVSAKGEFEYCWFLEIDRGTEHRPALVRKCRQYEAYWRTGIEPERSGTFPLVVWVTCDETRAREIEGAIRSARSLKHDLFRVTTSERLVALMSGGPR